MKAAMAPGRRTGVRAASSVGRSRLNPEATRILELQRQAGNRAVTQMLTGGPPALQRAISLQPPDLEVGRSWKDRLRTSFAPDSYSKIVRALKDFHAATEPGRKLLYADCLIGVTSHYLATHDRSDKGSSSVQRYRLVELLNAEALREAGKLRAEAIYLNDLASGGMEGASKLTGMIGAGPAPALAAGKAPTKAAGGGTDKEAIELIAKYQLTAAEVAAVRTYTLGDYLYINPAAANAEGWLKSNIDKVKAKGTGEFNTKASPKALKTEGATHAGMLMQALNKLEPWKGTAYRGTRVTGQTFLDKYGKGSAFPFSAFGSAAKQRAPAQKFADGEGGSPPAPGEVVSVLTVVKMTNGRDISKLSAMIVKEEEVLILPGAKFVVEDVSRLPSGNPGPSDVPARAWFIVRLTQVD